MLKSFFLFLVATISIVNFSHAQAASYTDPAQAYKRILSEKGSEGSFQRIGNFKVVGTSFLYGGNLLSNVYFKNGSVKNVMITYDTYRQELSFNMGSGDNTLINQLNGLDSFTIRADENTVYKTDLRFVNVEQFDTTQKLFLQKVATGPRFNLYKSYKSDLSYVSTNYIQSELRQFDLNYDYYYTDIQSPGLKKLKTGSRAVKKEFNDIKDISFIVDVKGYNSNPELSLIKVFTHLNN